MKLLNMVSAHTGNDLYDHGMTLADWIVGLVIIVTLILLIVFIIKKSKKRKIKKKK